MLLSDCCYKYISDGNIVTQLEMDIILGNIRAIRVTHTFSGHLHGEREESREGDDIYETSHCVLCIVWLYQGWGWEGCQKKVRFLMPLAETRVSN